MGEAGDRIQFGVTSVIYDCLCPHIFYLPRKAEALSSGAGCPRPRAAGPPWQGPRPWDGAGPQGPCAEMGMAAWGVGTGTVCCHIQPFPRGKWTNLQKCVLLWRRKTRGDSENEVWAQWGWSSSRSPSLSNKTLWDVPTLPSNKSCWPDWGLGISFFCFSESSQCCKNFANLKSGRAKPVLLYFSYLFPEACWQNCDLYCYKTTLGQNYLNREL